MATTRVYDLHAKKAPQTGVKMPALMKFLFPPHLEQAEATGRLDLFAHYGPVDDEGYLRGGMNMRHKIQDHEIRKMIWSMNESLFYELFARPKETVELVVKEILPKAVSHCYSGAEIRRLLSSVAADSSGRLPFAELQDIILKDQRRRLLILMDGGSIVTEPRKQIAFQTEPGKILTQVTRKKKLLPPQAFNYKSKLLNGSAGLIAPIEMQNMSDQLSNNILLLRGVGSLNDKWDRYCALRQTGKASYVGSRNWITSGLDRFGPGTKTGTAGSDFIASGLINGPRTAPKISIFPPKRQH